MATTVFSPSVPPQLYPLSTQDGKDIPNEVIKATFFAQLAVSTGSWIPFEIPSEEDILWFYSTSDALVSWASPLPSIPIVDGVAHPATLFIPAYTAIVVAPIALSMSLLSLGEAATIQVQGIQRWAALALPRQAIGR